MCEHRVSVFLLQTVCMKKFLALSCLCFLVLACDNLVKELENDENNDGKRDWIPEPDMDPAMPTVNGIAYANGFKTWKEVSEIRFTFNVARGERLFERSWIWATQTDEVVMMAKGDTVRYNRNKMDSLQLQADQAFINDKYWLLAPFNLKWDKYTTFAEEKNKVAPISGDTLDVLTVTYGDVGGYTPGDAYDFYYGKEYEIKEWVFREKNDSLPTMVTTWEDYKDFNGIRIATMHKDSLGDFKLFFTNISVKK